MRPANSISSSSTNSKLEQCCRVPFVIRNSVHMADHIILDTRYASRVPCIVDALNKPAYLNYPKIFWISASSFFMSPPTTLATFWPLLNSKKVGIALTSCSFAMLCSLSTSTWRKRTFSYFSLSWPTRGATALHGPHQVAKKSTTTGPEEMRALKTTGLQNC